ncbi:MAG: hypothetical protein AAGA06_05130 [Pseudomonadota bacterium]
MTGPTKILTVSYGTFSCTLEGFDDPLGSMREMAEYFRDLAADDRYFGAEPPTPDVEMLQRIAEKEVQRQVAARVTETGVALVAAEPRAEAPAVEPKPDAEEVAPDATPEPLPGLAETGPLAYDDDYLMSDEPEDVLFVEAGPAIAADGPAETVAEKLRRIRAVVSKNIEVDRSAAHREQSPNGDNPELRDRALTRTINQIQTDLEDDEDLANDEAVAGAEVSPEPAGDDWEMVQDVAQDESTEDEPADVAPIDEDWAPPLEQDTLEAPQADDETAPQEEDHTPERTRSVTEVLGSVSERVLQDDPVDAPAPREATQTLSPEPEADVGRLLDETDTKLNDDETVRRRRVISQMRAAVAATKADRIVSQQVSREVQDEAEKDPYRADLSEAVQDEPEQQFDEEDVSRPVSAPPLVLVSSQRIDSTPSGEGQGAAAFAAKFGAKELPELMEAAAAFTVFSEGQPSFTRPEIMQMVTRMDPSLQLSREESLRSFGQLLREGKFKKLERGQFTIDNSTRYNPEDHAAGI